MRVLLVRVGIGESSLITQHDVLGRVELLGVPHDQHAVPLVIVGVDELLALEPLVQGRRNLMAASRNLALKATGSHKILRRAVLLPSTKHTNIFEPLLVRLGPNILTIKHLSIELIIPFS